MKIKLTGKELIETLNKNFIGEFVNLDVNDVFWSGILAMREKRDFGTVYTAKGVTFYIFEDKEYFCNESKFGLEIKEVR